MPDWVSAPGGVVPRACQLPPADDTTHNVFSWYGDVPGGPVPPYMTSSDRAASNAIAASHIRRGRVAVGSSRHCPWSGARDGMGAAAAEHFQARRISPTTDACDTLP